MVATLGLFKKNVFWKKSYDVIISVPGVTSKILSLESNYIEDVVMWPKFGNSSISIREVIITTILQGFYQKNSFFEWCYWFKFNNLRLARGLYISASKGLRLKVRRFLRLIPTFLEVTGEKQVGGLSGPTPSWIGLKD